MKDILGKHWHNKDISCIPCHSAVFTHPFVFFFITHFYLPIPLLFSSPVASEEQMKTIAFSNLSSSR